MKLNIDATSSKSNSGCIDFLLVNLPFSEGSKNQSFHLGLLYVASNLKKKGFTVRVIDDSELDAASFLTLYRANRPHILGFYVNTDIVPKVKRVLEMLHNKGDIPDLVIFGGPHVTIKDKEFLQDNWGDIVVRGEGELTTLEIGRWFLNGKGQLSDIKGITYLDKNKNVIRNPDRAFIQNLDDLPFPDWTLLLNKSQLSTYQIISGRGCPFHCTFCAEGIAGIKYRFRSPESVLAEIRSIVGNKERIYLSILDDTFLVIRKRVEAIAHGLIKEYGDNNRLKWFCESRVDFIIRNPDIFPLLRKAGLVRVQIGIESGSQKILDLYRKQVKVEEIIRAVEILRDAEIPSIYGNFIIGGPYETADTISESLELARTLIKKASGRMECAASYLTIFPGTELSLNSNHYDLNIIDPDLMTCLSLQYPIVTPKGKSKHWVINQYNHFNLEIKKQYQAVMSKIPMNLIEEHLRLREYGINTQMSDIYLHYSCIRKCEDIKKRQNLLNDNVTDKEFAEFIPRRSGLLSSIDQRLTVLSHPQGSIIFNKMAGEIYELCSGKYRLREIIALLHKKKNNLPPEPYFSKQVFSLIRDLKKRYLLFYSDL